MKHRSLYRRLQRSRWRYSVTVAASFILCIAILDTLWLSNIEPEQSPEDVLTEHIALAINNGDPKLIRMLYQGLLDNGLEALLLSGEDLKVDIPINQPTAQIRLDETLFWLMCSSDNNDCLLIESKDTQGFTSAIPTLLFYCCLAGLFAIWLKPIFKGLNTLETAAKRFAQKPSTMNISEKTPHPIKSLAEHFDDMATKIHTLLDMQRDITHGLSHELRTPLARIKFALATIQPESKEISLYNSIHKDVHEIEALTDAMLSYARLEHANQLHRYEEIPFAALLDNVQRHTTTATHIDVAISNSETLLYCNVELIRLVLNNLLSNSYRFATSKIDVCARVSQSHYVIRVSDDGSGIPEHQIKNITKPFIKGANSTGFGFGLAFCQRIVELHKGTLSISKSADQGCCIEIRWPKKSPLN